MKKSLNISFFGSSLVSAYWNGAATYYRGIIKSLHAEGHRVTFYEPDIYDRQKNRDIEDPDWAKVVVYEGNDDGARSAFAAARESDVVVKTSGVGGFDELLERAVAEIDQPGTLKIFWDVDAPATLNRVHADTHDQFLGLIPN